MLCIMNFVLRSISQVRFVKKIFFMSKNTTKQEEVCEENFEKTCQITFKQEATRETIRKCYRYEVILQLILNPLPVQFVTLLFMNT